MVATNTRRTRTAFEKRVERWNANLVALTSLMGSLIGLLRRVAQVVLIVVAVIAVFSPGFCRSWLRCLLCCCRLGVRKCGA